MADVFLTGTRTPGAQIDLRVAVLLHDFLNAEFGVGEGAGATTRVLAAEYECGGHVGLGGEMGGLVDVGHVRVRICRPEATLQPATARTTTPVSAAGRPDNARFVPWNT
ncbi:hypothetical protein DF268_07725 [Streptomyces sp. V2]|nr:hypothetical protein DF268_07725 [Streptomyces sp. V2]